MYLSDAVKMLLKKQFLEKDFSPLDNRRYNLSITSEGRKLVNDLAGYALPLSDEITTFSKQELTGIYDTISKLIFQLNQKGIIRVQRTCFNCQHYEGDRKKQHFCKLLKEKLKSHEVRLDCEEFEEKAHK